MLETAVKIAEFAFRDKVDKASKPYIQHLERVANAIPGYFGVRGKIVAYLHDLLEDCPEWNEKSLRTFFSDETVDAVIALTHKKGQSYDDYIEQVSNNECAKIVKIHDLTDNMNITRLETLSEKDYDRLKKYHKAYKRLVSSVIGSIHQKIDNHPLSTKQ